MDDTTPGREARSSDVPSANGLVEGMAGFTHRFASVNGTRIHYVIGGGGPAVVLLHGFPYTWAVWRRLMPLLSEAGFTVIASDLRGLGDSAPAEGGYGKANVAEDVRALVRSLGFEAIELVGADIGMMVAYTYAAAHPEEVRHLVLAESLIPGFGLEERMNPATGGYWHFGFHMQVELAAMLIGGKEEAYLTPYYAMMSASKDAAAEARALYLAHYAKPGGIRAGLQHYGPLLEDGKHNRAVFRAKLTTPVLVLNGERGIPQGQTLDCVRQVAENVEHDLVPNAGHTFADDNPTWTAERLIRFLRPDPA